MQLPIVTCLLLQCVFARVWPGLFELHSQIPPCCLLAWYAPPPHVSVVSLFKLVHDFSKMVTCMWQEIAHMLFAYGAAEFTLNDSAVMTGTSVSEHDCVPKSATKTGWPVECEDRTRGVGCYILPACLTVPVYKACLLQSLPVSTGTARCSHSQNSGSTYSWKSACRMWFMHDEGCSSSRHERMRIAKRCFSGTVDWAWWLIFLTCSLTWRKSRLFFCLIITIIILCPCYHYKINITHSIHHAQQRTGHVLLTPLHVHFNTFPNRIRIH